MLKNVFLDLSERDIIVCMCSYEKQRKDDLSPFKMPFNANMAGRGGLEVTWVF